MLAKQIQKNNKDFEEDVFWTEEWDGSLFEIRYVLKQSQLSLIDILNQFINEKSNRTIIDSAGEMSDVYIGRLGAFKEIEDYLKAEKAIIEKI